MSEPRHNPKVGNLEEAEFWIGVLHHRSIRDVEEINALRIRVRLLEQPWWRRILRRAAS